ncbi:MAG: hypothetical protein II532_00960 [Bacteroidales bacterium]|nr:hypothetical protein [Bacteroidales bacterium]
MAKGQPQQYRVLWVDEEDDQWSFVDTARRYNLIVHQYRTWAEAREALDMHFSAFSAIVLDGRGVIRNTEEPNPDFLYQAVRELQNLFSVHEEFLPWYVLSSGTAPDFENTLRRVSMGSREEHTPFWGDLYYHKGDDLSKMCETMRRAAANRKPNKVGRIYKDVFDVMKRYFESQSVNTMLDILVALHYPEDHRDFDPLLYYTQLRRILEHLFRAANKLGILPDEVLGNNDKVNLSNSSLFLSGREVNIGDGRIVRYGRIGESFFPQVQAQIVKSILVVANKNSHTTELNRQEVSVMRDYYNSIHSNNLLFGYALQLCDVIVWFGHAVERGGVKPNHSSQTHYSNNNRNNK